MEYYRFLGDEINPYLSDDPKISSRESFSNFDDSGFEQTS